MTEAKPVSQPVADSPAQWMEQVYPELRRIAAQHFRHERPDHTWQPTELVHEVFVRLANSGPTKCRNRAHFFGTVARAMRRTLVEHARRRQSKKRGGTWQRVAIEDADIAGVVVPDCVAVDEALKKLKAIDPKLHQIAELRIFAGLSTGEIASLLRRGKSTVRRDWRFAKMCLQRELTVTVCVDPHQ